MPEPIVNIAAYKFVVLEDLLRLRQELRVLSARLGLKGTVLLSPEGINLFVSGVRDSVDSFLADLRKRPALADLQVKESLSDHQPFTRMLVRLKREIIAFGVDSVDPLRRPARRIAATELKQWLDEGRPVTLLDTRNDYEVKMGTFAGALAAGIADFRSFPEAVSRLPEELKGKPVVTFCTGGIRCEKAAPYLEQQGFGEVYQLDGGILKYFEECGGAHYQGDCFVFDQRVALNPELKESGAAQCFACREPLSREDTRSAYYVPGQSCPHCHESGVKAARRRIEVLEARIHEVCTPLPGSVPYENRRPIHVPERAAGLPAIEFLAGLKTVQSREDWTGIIAGGRLRSGDRPVTSDQRLKPGERLVQIIPHTVEPEINPAITVLYEDDEIVVLNKPAPLPMHPCGRFNRNSLQWILERAFHPDHPRPVHRLDANTTGVVVCARTRRIASLLQPQFERGSVRKRYLVRVHGHPREDQFESTASISREPGAAGGRMPDPAGLTARTRFSVLSRRVDHTSVLEAVPLTGRTNQIRIHLWGLGHPVLGDPLYQRDGVLGVSQTLEVGAPPMHLHAAAIDFEHPLRRGRVILEAPCPWWEPGPDPA